MSRHLDTPRLWRHHAHRHQIPSPRPGLLAAVWSRLRAEAAGIWQDDPYPHPEPLTF